MTVPALFGAVKTIAESSAQIPCILYGKDAKGNRVRATDHPAYGVLHDHANDWTSAFEFRLQMYMAALTHGNAYAWIGRAGGRVKELIQLPSDRVEVKATATGEPSYTVTDDKGRKTDYGFRDIFHLRGPGVKLLEGDSPIVRIRNALAVALAAEEHTGRSFQHGLKPSGWLKTPGKLSPEAVQRLKDGLAKNYGGQANSGRPMVLESGLEWVEAQTSAKDAELIEQRKFCIAEIARAYRLPLHFLGDMERATFSNVEEMGQQFVTYTLAPWLLAWEGAVSRSILTKAERETYYSEHLIDALVRADLSKRFAAYAIALGRAGEPGFMLRDEIRERENLSPRPEADFRAPANPNNGAPDGTPTQA